MPAYTGRFRSQGGQRGPVKIKIMSFPAVEQHGPLLFGEAVRDQQLLIQVMKNLGHSPQPLPGIDQHGFRRLKGLSRLQQPGKIKGIDPNLEPGILVHIHLGGDGKIAAVHQMHGIDLPVDLVRIGRDQGRKGVVPMPAGPSGAAGGLHPLLQTPPPDMALPPPGAGEMEQVKAAVQQVDIGGAQFFHPYRLGFVLVYNLYRFRDGVMAFKDAEAQRHLHGLHKVRQPQLQRLAVLGGPDGGQTLQFLFPAVYAVGRVAQIGGAGAVRI